MLSLRRQVALLTLGVVLFLDVLRVFLPSLITLFGQAGSTAPELMGLYAAAWFVLPFLALLLRPRWAVLVGAVALVLARVLLQTGAWQLHTSSVGVTAGLIFLYGCARTTVRPAAPVGIMAGLTVSFLGHLLLDGVDLVWRSGILPWASVAALCVAFLLLTRTSPSDDTLPTGTEDAAPPLADSPTPAQTEDETPAQTEDETLPSIRHGSESGLAPAGTWFLFGPVLLLTGMAATGYAKAATGPDVLDWDALLLVPALVVATVLAARPYHSPVLVRVAAVLLVGATALLPSSAVLGLSGALVLLSAGPVLAASAQRPAGARQGVAVLGGALVFLVATFAYYASYDLDLGIPNQVWPIAVAVTAAVVAVRPGQTHAPRPQAPETRPPHPRAPQDRPLQPPAPQASPPHPRAPQDRPLQPPAPQASPPHPQTPQGSPPHPQTPQRRPLRLRALHIWRPAAMAAALAMIVAVTTSRPVPEVRQLSGDTVKLVVYNIRMGFGMDGRLSLDDIASWTAAQRPDVVLLSEVDRGWLLNGGHDDLARIARGLGMRYHFAPAADHLWGDALLTNLAVRDVHSHPLGRHDYPTGAQAQAIVLGVGDRELGIVNTHLQAPAGQAPAVAAMVRALAAGRSAAEAGPDSQESGEAIRPVVLAGDLNIRPGDPEMRVLEQAGLSDPLLVLGDPPTSPADNPEKRIDHVLITDGLTALSAEAPLVRFSDHLPVVATVRLTTVDQQG